MNKSETDLITRYNQTNNFGKLLGMHFNVVGEGSVEYYLVIKQDHLATPYAAHGGVVAALADAALGTAGLSVVASENKAVSTVEFKINYLSPALLGDELIAKAKVEHKGNRLLVVCCDILCVNRNNTLIAKSMGTFNAYDATKAGY